MAWERFVPDVIFIVATAVLAYLRGRMSEQLRIEVLRWMRVVEKTMDTKDNQILENAVVELMMKVRGEFEEYAKKKIIELIRKEAGEMKPLVKFANWFKKGVF